MALLQMGRPTESDPTYTGTTGPAGGGQVRSTASVLAIVAALGSFYLSSSHHAGWGFVAAVVAVVSGLLGALRAASPRVSGGILSIAAIVLGVVALLMALVAGIAR